jgi:IclR family KDG regulon transcriptional repressor
MPQTAQLPHALPHSLKPGQPGSIVQSLDRGLVLLQHVCLANRPVTLGELAELLEIEKSSVHRLMATLIRRGFVIQDPSKSYLPGLMLLELSSTGIDKASVFELAQPLLRVIARTTGETAHLATLKDSELVITHNVNSSQLLAVNTRVGQREPLHCTALGKALLCETGLEGLRGLLGNRFKGYTERTIVTLKELHEACQRVAETGVADDEEEFRVGIHCLAAPIRGASGSIVAAIGLSGPSSRMNKTTLPKLREEIRHAAIQISVKLGWREPANLSV